MNAGRGRPLLGCLALLLAVGAHPAVAATPPAETAAETRAAPVAGRVGPPHLPDAFEDLDDVPMPDPDLWHRIRVGFLMDALDSPLVQEQEAWYASRPEYIKRFVDRGSRYMHYIVEQVEKRGMPMEVALLPIIESAFTPRAMSRAKASGIWQFIPSTGKSYGLTQNWWRDNRNDVVAATDAALNYLQRLHDMFGNWELAFAAYNCGEGCVGRAIAANQKRGLPTDYLSLKLPPETRHYVPKLIAVKNIVLSPVSYGIEIESIPDSPYFTTVEAPARIDVKLAAALAEMDEEEFAALNPAHNKPVAVSVSGTNRLVLPVDKVQVFKDNLEAWDKPLVSWTTYNARRGESLDAIARRHGMVAAQLRAANDSLRLDRRGRLRAGGPVMVPIRAGSRAVALGEAAAKQLATTVSMPANTAKTYVVRAGDTLYDIARRFNTGVDKLLALNKLTAKSIIQPGLRLSLP
ncbi:MAG TPA: transglycosylase SLT domain-containing protein [Usitatibacter sp.]|nr:transglycosylase SLT domain-containing protein [Usitatibacter sp.]